MLFPIVSIAGLNVSRKAYVSQADNFVRRLNILENPTGADITVTVGMDTDLGSDDSTSVIATSSGDTTVDALNPWSFFGRLNCMGALAESGFGKYTKKQWTKGAVLADKRTTLRKLYNPNL